MKEIQIPVKLKLYFTTGKSKIKGHNYNANFKFRIKTTLPIFMAYIYLAYNIIILGIRSLFDSKVRKDTLDA